jgi:hypothetical protein
MNHIPYELATAHRDELLRRAAGRTLASRAAASGAAARPATATARRRRRDRVRRLRIALRG